MKKQKNCCKTEEKNKYFEIFEALMDECQKIEAESRREVYPRYKEASESLNTLFIYYKLRLYCSEISYRLLLSQEKKLAHTLKDFKCIDFIRNEIALLLEQIEMTKNTEIVEKILKQQGNIVAYGYLFNFLEKYNNDKKIDALAYIKIFEWMQNHRKYILKDTIEGIFSILGSLAANIKEIQKYSFLANVEIINNFDEKQYLPTGVYKNVITLGLDIEDVELLQSLSDKKINNKYQWAKAFCKKYEKRLKEDNNAMKGDKILYFEYCMGLIEFEQQNFEVAYTYLQNKKRKKGIFINAAIKMLQIKVMFELLLLNNLDNEKKLVRTIDNLRKFLENDSKDKKQLKKENQEYYINFLQLVRKMYRLEYKKQDKSAKILNEKKKKLMEEVEKCDVIKKQTAWFKVKLAQIKKI